MSLILDALRKLEREKAARDSGVLVVGSVPWGGTSPTRRLAVGAAAVAALGLAGLAGWLLRPGAAPPSAAVGSKAPAPVPAPRVAATPTPAPLPPAAAPSGVVAAPPIALSRPLPESAPRAARAAAPLEPAPPSATAPAKSISMPPSPQAAAPEPAAQAPLQSETADPSQAAGARGVDSPAAAVGAGADAPAPAPAEGLRLTAISQRDGRPVALINDRLVFEGDSFDGVRVVRIGDAEVEVEVGGERRVLRF